ncbi:MAG: methylenetetrahydrofolate--tRNA-(uracil(54)-C(5))-methyltransferase (FADH(2)-oxidizing) TrmFO [Bdellovibrionales bacterium]|nr:methylenetetrahydrofolate--tRNA-(uracil(54)-C(5))-methyltransferase (FADH(2)-oxidizing) TrmFO [Bdellovibrionales bacterium]
MFSKESKIHIVGAGLAGSECAWQLAEMGFSVQLYEMRPKTSTPAHKTGQFAELVCSNSFGSLTDYSAPGQLKWEAEALGSLILKSAKEAAVPAGMALGVDREVFSKQITLAIRNHPNIEVVEKVVENLNDIPRPAILATGPLTHSPLAESLRTHFDNEFLYFYDAIAPIIDADTIDGTIAFKADRFQRGNADYYNCPLTKEQYYDLIASIKSARKIESKEFENTPYFDGCMPIEAIIERGDETLRFGPLSPKGIRHPETDERYFAVVQLRQDNKEATAYNMVGFQTKMAYGDQKEIFRKIPGLENAEFLKLGSIHRNLYIHSPKLLNKDLSSPKDEWLFFAGQITGVEGYFESTCIGLLVSHFLKDKIEGLETNIPPRTSAFGSLYNAITEAKEDFQPTNINWGLFPRPTNFNQRGRKFKEMKRLKQIYNAKNDMAQWLEATKPFITLSEKIKNDLEMKEHLYPQAPEN